jgi:hypothetical protein
MCGRSLQVSEKNFGVAQGSPENRSGIPDPVPSRRKARETGSSFLRRREILAQTKRGLAAPLS